MKSLVDKAADTYDTLYDTSKLEVSGMKGRIMAKVHTTCRLKPLIWKELKAKAIEEGGSRNEIIEAALAEYLDCDTEDVTQRITVTRDTEKHAINSDVDMASSECMTREELQTADRDTVLSYLWKKGAYLKYPAIEVIRGKWIRQGREAWERCLAACSHEQALLLVDALASQETDD